MKGIISKELLAIVLNINYKFTIQEQKHYDLNLIKWWRSEAYKEEMIEINIYELAHKCKEWAIKKGYSISSRLSSNGEEAMTSVFDINNDLDFIPNASIHGGKEFNAIFYSCQWILDNKGSK